jgi:hypothetical protein
MMDVAAFKSAEDGTKTQEKVDVEAYNSFYAMLRKAE